jgi:zinc protease
MTARVMQEVKRLQQEGPTEDLTNRAKESARRTYETSLKQNNYWLGRLVTINMLGGNPADIVTRGQRIDGVTRQTLQDVFKKYFPADRSTIVTLVPAPTQG